MDPFIDLSLTSTNNETMVQDSPNGVSFPIYYNDVYEVPLPPKHRFPMSKYRKVRERIQSKVSSQDHQTQNKVQVSFRISPLVSVQDLALTHCEEYISRYIQGQQTSDEIRNVGFPWSTAGVSRSLSSTGGTVAAAKAVCDAKRQCAVSSQLEESFSQGPFWSAHVAGGTHHAFHDRGEGFCVFSDIAVAANVILRDYPDIVKRILIVDLDVHQGNGNAVLFQGRKDVITFSMHCSSNYFSKKEASDLDIELPTGCDDETYLSTLHYWLNRIYKDSNHGKSTTNTTTTDKFDFIFYQAGVDILQSDRLGRMNISPEGVSRRNKMVYEFATKMDVPFVITMGGGYPKENDWEPILEAHAGVYTEAFEYLLSQS